ncbi:hypothetical protein HT031_000904 [Scenedesmus sp. PABB004]|nr:hypothetical protein HT031_000904 [Scenedesmus sp. PABB004]
MADWAGGLPAPALALINLHLDEPAAASAARRACRGWRAALPCRRATVFCGAPLAPAGAVGGGCAACGALRCLATRLAALPQLADLAVVAASSPQPPPVCACGAGAAPAQALAGRLARLTSLELDTAAAAGAQELWAQHVLPQLTRLLSLTLRAAWPAAADGALALLARAPAQLRRLRLLPARAGAGGGAPTPLELPAAAHLAPLRRLTALEELRVGVPLVLRPPHAQLLGELLQAGRLRVLELPHAAWADAPAQRAQRGLTAAQAPREAQQSSAAALAAVLRAGGGGLASLHLGAVQGAELPGGAALAAALAALTALTELQLPAPRGLAWSAALAPLSGLRSVHLTWPRSAPEARCGLGPGALRAMVGAWPHVSCFAFEGHVALGPEAGGWELFSAWQHLRALAIGPPRLPPGHWDDPDAGTLPVSRLPARLTRLSLTNVPLDALDAPLACAAMLETLRMHWPWRVNDMAACGLPCLAGCAHLTSLELVGVSLEPKSLDTVLGDASPCPRLQALAVEHCRCAGAADLGLARALRAGGGGRLARLRLHAGDSPEPLLALAGALRGLVASAAESDGPRRGGVRDLSLACTSARAGQAQEVLQAVREHCRGLARLELLLWAGLSRGARARQEQALAAALPGVLLQLSLA